MTVPPVSRVTSGTWAGSTGIPRTCGSTRARRYVKFMGGADVVLEKARKSLADGDPDNDFAIVTPRRAAHPSDVPSLVL